MIVQAHLLNNDKYIKHNFLVRFEHTPVNQVSKKHPRKCIATIYLIDVEPTLDLNDDVKVDGQRFTSKLTGDTYIYKIGFGESICQNEDQYVKAFGRLNSIKKALKNLIVNGSELLDHYGYKFDNRTFKEIIKELNVSHTHGKELAMQLMQSKEYCNE